MFFKNSAHHLFFQHPYKNQSYGKEGFNFYSSGRILTLLFSFLLFFPMFGFAQENSSGAGNLCTTEMQSCYTSLLKGSASHKTRENFFTALYDGLQLFSERHDSDKNKDHFTTEDISKFFYYDRDFSPVRAWESAVKSLIIKKILIGGSVDKLTKEELQQLINLVYDYENFFIHIKNRISFFHAVLTGESFSISTANFNRSIERLQWAFTTLLQAYRREKVSYSVSDFHQIDDYAQVLNYSSQDFLIILRRIQSKEGNPVVLNFKKTVKYAKELRINSFSFKEAGQWKNLSDFLHFWGSGAFKRPIAGNRWMSFANSIKPFISLFFTHRVYIAGRDIFKPQVFSIVLGGLEMVVDSMIRSESVHWDSGFPVTHFTGLVKAILSQAKDSEGLSSSPLAHLIEQDERDSLFLITRALVCFSISPMPSDCKVVTPVKKSEPISIFLFPDGKYVFQRNGRRQWIPFSGKTFTITKNQLQSLKHWLKEFRSHVDSIEINPHSVAENYGFSHWMADFFGEDQEKRVWFGYTAGSEAQASLSYSLLNYSAFLKFLLSPWLKQSEGKETFSLNLTEWNQLTDKMFPVLSALFQIDYTDELKGMSSFLFEYGDLLLNSSNQNKKLEFKELLDVTVHLSSAQKSSQFAFKWIQLNCGRELKKECVSRQLFHNTKNLSNFPQILDYIVSFGTNDFASPAKDSLPEVIKNAYDLMPLFLAAQLTEVLFYNYDSNRDFQLEPEEFQALVKKGLSTKFTSRMPHIHDDRQAEIYIRYAIEKGIFAFLIKKDEMFSAFNVSDRITHPKSYKRLPIYRYQIFAFIINLYNLNKKFGKGFLEEL